MDVNNFILKELKQKGQIKASQIVKQTGFSRAYVNRFFQQLRNEGKILLIGKTNKSIYVLTDPKSVNQAKKNILNIDKDLINKNLDEALVLAKVKKQSGIFLELSKNIIDILDFSFLEMLNNAIDHSDSSKITVKIKQNESEVNFWIIDQGIGIFNSIKKKFNLPDDLIAIEHLLKGQQTTDPKKHSGQGIFFTSKLADVFTIVSNNKRLRFIKSLDDIFIDNVKFIKGTKIFFSINKNSRTLAKKIFNEFSNEEFEFSKTKIAVRLSRNNQGLVSRSEARRIIMGLDKFKEIIFDFKNVDIAGQGFCDEIFRVWKNSHPKIKTNFINANKNVEFMIKRVSG